MNTLFLSSSSEILSAPDCGATCTTNADLPDCVRFRILINNLWEGLFFVSQILYLPLLSEYSVFEMHVSHSRGGRSAGTELSTPKSSKTAIESGAFTADLLNNAYKHKLLCNVSTGFCLLKEKKNWKHSFQIWIYGFAHLLFLGVESSSFLNFLGFSIYTASLLIQPDSPWSPQNHRTFLLNWWLNVNNPGEETSFIP